MRRSSQSALTSALALPLTLLICFFIYVLKNARTGPTSSLFRFERVKHAPSFTLNSSNVPRAPQLSPAELMARPLHAPATSIPKLFHQSWSTEALPADFQQWSLSCREANPDFEWVLWTDEDNRRLVETYAPEILVAYDGLKSEIYRADTVRNLYMFVFGG